MSIKKRLILIISAMTLLAVMIYALISTSYINSEFSGYVASEYSETVSRIKTLAVKILAGEDDAEQLEQTLATYLGGLIAQISVFDAEGEAVVSVQNNMPLMHNRMMNGQPEETDYFTVTIGEAEAGHVAITRTSAIQYSETVQLFKQALIKSAIISGLVALVISIAVIVFTSTKMTKDLRQTARYANDADNEKAQRIIPSKVAEIRAIQQSLENLSAKLRMQKRVRQEKIDQISHEIRTPLAILKTNCEAARDKVIKMDESRLDSCLSEIDHLASVFETITDVIAYENEPPNAHNEAFDLAETMRQIIKGFRLQYEKKEILLTLESERHVSVHTDRLLLSQAVYNLLSNACKFTPRGGRVTVSVTITHGRAAIRVCNNGPGIPEPDLNRIFEAYQRGTALQDTPGEGLGLFIARRNIETVGGTILAQNQKEGGVCFIIDIPVE